jgi:hypothetical protein
MYAQRFKRREVVGRPAFQAHIKFGFMASAHNVSNLMRSRPPAGGVVSLSFHGFGQDPFHAMFIVIKNRFRPLMETPMLEIAF